MRQVGDRLIPVGITSSRAQLPEGITTVEVSYLFLPYVLVTHLVSIPGYRRSEALVKYEGIQLTLL